MVSDGDKRIAKVGMSSLKTKTKRGLYWSAAGNFANQGLRFVFGIILARLLAPEAHGVIGMLGVFISLKAVVPRFYKSAFAGRG